MSDSAKIKMPKRFDYSSSVQFNAAVDDALGQKDLVVLDCSDLDYIDSAGIGLLVMAQKKAQSRQSKIALSHLKTGPKEILTLANLQKIIDIY